jgi:hypothetical protein
MKKVNVSSSHKAGRRTQVMAENFADLAGLANEKLIDKSANAAKNKEVLTEILACIEVALKKSDDIPMGPRLQEVMKALEAVSDDLHEYMLDKH